MSYVELPASLLRVISYNIFGYMTHVLNIYTFLC